jgi:hypothetical protein
MREHGSIHQHRETIVEKLPSGKLDVVEVFGPPERDRPSKVVCDCCLDHFSRLKCWAHRGFCVRLPDGSRREFVAGSWSFCRDCERPFVARDAMSLIDRVLRCNPDLEPEAVSILYEAMFGAVYGEPEEWHADMPVPTLGIGVTLE